MLEREVKILDINKEEIKKTIADRGCNWSESFLVTDSYRDSEDRRYHAQKKKIKLRVISNKP
jgi:adenylate cyclase class IV